MINYKVNKKNGVVIAFFGDDSKSSGNAIIWRSNILDYLFKKLGYSYHETQIPPAIYDIVSNIVYNKSKFVGIARCKGADVFDEEVGKNLAKENLLKRYFAARDMCVEAVRKYFINNFAKLEVATRGF